VLGCPRADRGKWVLQGLAEFGQGVFHVLGGAVLEHSPFDQPVAFHAAQGLGQHFLPGDAAFFQDIGYHQCHGFS
jgi:hypothetical protein